MLELIAFAIVGLVAGILAKALAPGEKHEPQGCIATMLLGMAGAITMGFLVRLTGWQARGGMVPSIIGATIGALLLIWIMRKAFR